MLKNTVIAVLVAILLSYTMGYAVSDWFDMRIQFDDHMLEPVTSMLTIAGVAMILIMIGFVVAVSVVSVVVFAVIAAVVGLFVVGLGAFWPMLLLAAMVIWLVKGNNQTA